MGLDKITTKFQEALQAAQQLASRSAHAELKSLHVLLALLQQDGGIVVPILEKAGIDITKLKANALTTLDREPSIQGAAAQPQMSYGLRANLDASEGCSERSGEQPSEASHSSSSRCRVIVVRACSFFLLCRRTCFEPSR
ncbi:MAG: Clp protease N-terminal domain-containing protein [Akkermansiaceae bacterium]